MSVKDREYHNVHYAVRVAFGKPDFCEHCEAEDGSTRFEWAHVHDAPLEVARENWKRLCNSCHGVYDNLAEKASNTLKGRKPSDEERQKMSEAMKIVADRNRETTRSNQIERIQKDPTLVSRMLAGVAVQCACEICGREFNNLGAKATHRKSHNTAIGGI